VSAKLASPATETDLRITCAEVLGAVGHANAEAAQAVLNQQGAHAFFHTCNEYKARSVGQHIDLSEHLRILALYDKNSEQQAALSFMRAPYFAPSIAVASAIMVNVTACCFDQMAKSMPICKCGSCLLLEIA